LDIDGKFDALINLNGENIFGTRNKGKKQKVFEIRVKLLKSFVK
jgi:NAD dependent epimerase/dehydratase family enzyme